MDRDRGANLRLGGTVSDSMMGGTRHFFLLTLYNFKNIGGPHAPRASPGSAVPGGGYVVLKLI